MRHRLPQRSRWLRKHPRLTPQFWTSLLNVVQILGIIGSGAWALVSFLTFQNKQEEFRTRQMQLSNQQLEIQEREARALQDVQVRAKEAEFSYQIRDLQSGKMKVTHHLDIDCQKSDKYSGSFGYKIENFSKTDVEVSWTLMQRYLGILTMPKDQEAIVALNDPPIPMINDYPEGPINWKDQGYWGAYYDSTHATLSIAEFPQYKFHMYGQGTKYLRPGEYSEGEDNFVVFSKPGNYVAVVLSIEFNDKSGDRNSRTHVFNWDELKPCEKYQKKAVQSLRDAAKPASDL
jgi:hypothetical protein